MTVILIGRLRIKDDKFISIQVHESITNFTPLPLDLTCRGRFKFKSATMSSGLLEAVSKLHLRPNLGVGTNRSVLEILDIFLRLNNLSRLDLEPDLLF